MSAGSKPLRPWQVCAGDVIGSGKRVEYVYGLHVAHDGKKEKKPLRAEWLVHELTDAGEEV